MKKVKLEIPSVDDFVYLSSLPEYEAIFVRNSKGKLVGMVRKTDEGWGIALDHKDYSSGFHPTREKAMEVSVKYGYTFEIDL